MQPSRKALFNSNAGVWGEKLHRRVDLEKYSYALRRGDNFQLTPFGILEKRPGTKYIASTKINGAAILWPFQFSTTVGYVIEVGAEYMRFYRDGAQILDGASAYEIATPYLAADLRDLQFRQINDVVYITHTQYAPRKLIRLTDTTFSITEVVFDLPPFRDENITAATITPSGTTSSITLTADNVPSGTTVFTADNVGGYFRIGQKRTAAYVKILLKDISNDTFNTSDNSAWIDVLGDYEIKTHGRAGGVLKVIRENPITLAEETVAEFDIDNGNRNIDWPSSEETRARLKLNWTHRLREGSATNYQPNDDGGEDSYAYLEVADFYVYGYAKVTAYTSATQVTATVIDQFYDTSASAVWEESSWSDRRGYPKSCTLYEQRMFYAGNTAQPLAIWATRTGDFENFLYGVDDDNAFSYDLPSTELNPIEWIAAQKEIIVGNGKEYGILGSGSDDLPLTPTNANYRIQESVGYSGVKPEIIGDIMVGVERNGRRIREIAYQFDRGRSGGYVAGDLNRLNEDIIESGVLEIDYQQLREPYIHCVMTDGTMGVLHYNRADGIVGWTPWITAGSFESVAIIRGSDNDEVWVVVKRTVNGSEVRFVERFHPTRWTALEDAYYVDAGITYDGAATTTITGLDHLNGATVKVMADGAVLPDAVPVGGSITLSEAASVVHVGLGFTPYYQPMRFDVDGLLGNSQGHQKRIDEVILSLYKSREVQFGIGTSSNTMKLRETTDEMGEPYPLQTGDFPLDLASSFGDSFDSNDPQFFITQDSPCPLTILAVIVKYSVSTR